MSYECSAMLYSNVARVGLTGVWLKECRIKREALLGAAVRRDEVHGSTMRRIHPTRRLRAARSAQIGAVQPENRPRDARLSQNPRVRRRVSG